MGCPIVFSLFHALGTVEQKQADDKHHRKNRNRPIGAAGDLRCQTDQSCAQKGCAFAADVEQAEEFSGVFRRDDLRKIGT